MRFAPTYIFSLKDALTVLAMDIGDGVELNAGCLREVAHRLLSPPRLYSGMGSESPCVLHVGAKRLKPALSENASVTAYGFSAPVFCGVVALFVCCMQRPSLLPGVRQACRDCNEGQAQSMQCVNRHNRLCCKEWSTYFSTLLFHGSLVT
mmetsp:Transcript_72377/g.127619  ORF Transcript_72377/g.127619 Transcript_72377/m.127619 type:complete len:150 (-) Transcript_72377:347-796(-)